MHNLTITPVTDRKILDQRMTLLATDARAAGAIEGTGSVVVVDHTMDNNLVTFRFKHAEVRMLAADDDFTHIWQRTRDEGLVRAALDTYGVPYTYIADQKVREGNVRARYDVIIFPHVGGTATAQVHVIPKTGPTPLPYKRTDVTPNLGALDESDDIRGGMGLDGLAELGKFVEAGGTLIVEGARSTIFPEYGLTSGVTVEEPPGLFARGAIFHGVITDKKTR